MNKRIKPNSLTKPVGWKPCPRSPLQRAQAQKNWLKNFRLQDVRVTDLEGLPCTQELAIALHEYAVAVTTLRLAIDSSYSLLKKHLDKK